MTGPSHPDPTYTTALRQAAAEAMHLDTIVFRCPACDGPICNRDQADGFMAGVYDCPICQWFAEPQ